MEREEKSGRRLETSDFCGLGFCGLGLLGFEQFLEDIKGEFKGIRTFIISFPLLQDRL